MNDPQPKPAPSQNLIKMLLIPVLGAVLYYVLFSPADNTTPATVMAPVGLSSHSRPSPTTFPMATPEASDSAVTVTWPSVPVADVLATNPFRMPEALRSQTIPVAEDPPAPTPAAVQAQAAEHEKELVAELRAAVKEHRLSGLVRTSQGIGAIVGDEVVTVGDTIGDRLRVTAVRPEGIVLELIQRPVGRTDRPASQ